MNIDSRESFIVVDNNNYIQIDSLESRQVHTQDKTKRRQDKTRHAKTRQDKTRHQKTTQDKTGKKNLCWLPGEKEKMTGKFPSRGIGFKRQTIWGRKIDACTSQFSVIVETWRHKNVIFIPRVVGLSPIYLPKKTRVRHPHFPPYKTRQDKTR